VGESINEVSVLKIQSPLTPPVGDQVFNMWAIWGDTSYPNLEGL
jgi:hypothetical protein